MPEKRSIERARRDRDQGKPASRQAGEFVREEMEALKQGGGPRSRRQAIAIGLSRARRAGVELPPPRGRPATARKATRDLEKGRAGPLRKRTPRR